MDSILSAHKQRLHKRRKRVYESTLSRHKKQSYLYGQFIGIWKILIRSMVESPHFNTSSIRDEWYCWKSRTTSERRNLSSIADISIGWKTVGWFYGMLLLSAKCPWPHGRKETPYERRLGEPFKGPIVPCGAMVEYHPFSLQDQSRLHQSGKKVLPEIFLSMNWSPVEFGKEMFWLRIGKIYKSWTHQKFIFEGSTRKKHWYHKKEMNSSSQ